MVTRQLSLAAVTAFAMTACASSPPTGAPPRPDPALEALQRSAKEIQASWNAIGAIDKAGTPDSTTLLAQDSGVYGPGLSKMITLRYSGDIRAATIELAVAAGAQFKETGARPPTAIPIHIEVENRKIGEVLRDVGYQAGRRAGIQISSLGGKEVVELLYVTGAN